MINNNQNNGLVVCVVRGIVLVKCMIDGDNDTVVISTVSAVVSRGLCRVLSGAGGRCYISALPTAFP